MTHQCAPWDFYNQYNWYSHFAVYIDLFHRNKGIRQQKLEKGVDRVVGFYLC